MKNLFLLVVISMLCLNCSAKVPSKISESNSQKPIARDELDNAIRGYLKWFRENRLRLDRFALVSGKPGDATKMYTVNFAQTDLYLNELKTSGFVSNTYIENFRKYFKTCNENLIKYPQYDGPAIGFGFDQVMGSMEPEEILDRIETLKITRKIHGSKALASINVSKYMELTIGLTNENTKWLIDSIHFEPIQKK